MNELVIVQRAGAITTLQLNNGKVNALSTHVLNALESAAQELTHDASCRVVIVKGGEKIFAAGADITQFCESADPERFQIGEPTRIAEIGAAFASALAAIERLPQITIAAVTGPALGGGCELALACDFRVCNDRAVFGQPEILLGIIPGGGGTQRLPRLIGVSRAKDMIFTGRTVRAEEAEAIGLANRVWPSADFEERLHEYVQQLATLPPRGIAIAKRVIDRGIEMPLGAAIDLEADGFVEVFATPHAATGVRSFLADGPGKAVFD